MEEDIRWKQRFANFERDLFSLKEVISEKDINEDLKVDAAIKRFELTFELAWKTLQDYLLAQGYSGFKGPKNILAQSLQDKIIADNDQWTSMLTDRNTLVHVYDFDKSRIIFTNIETSYILVLEQLYNKLKHE